MPTYDYQCPHCGETAEVLQSIGSYLNAPIRPNCPTHGPMERRLSVVPAMSGLANALAGDRHYDGLRATDGTDISSRAKHRAYMKSRGLTDAGDFKETWQKAEAERTALRAGTFQDKQLRQEIERQVVTAVAQPD